MKVVVDWLCEMLLLKDELVKQLQPVNSEFPNDPVVIRPLETISGNGIELNFVVKDKFGAVHEMRQRLVLHIGRATSPQ